MRYAILLLLVDAHDSSCKQYSHATTTPFFVISLSKKRALSVMESLRNVTTHVEMTLDSPARLGSQHVPAVHGNVSAHEYVFHMAQYHHLMRRNTASELGCALSHVHALKRADEYCDAHGCDMAVVMEDDVSTELLPFWSTSISQLTHNLPDSWAVVQLQLIAQRKEWSDLIADWRQTPRATILQDRRRHFGTGAYLIHRRGIQQVLSYFVVRDVPSRAATLKGTMGTPGVPVVTQPGSLKLPLSSDEVQADVHLLYSLAAPVFLATPPLFSCKHATSSVEHYSTIRLQAQGAGKEDVLAHAISEAFALEWAREAHHASINGTLSAELQAQYPRLEHRSAWRHLFCQTLVVRGTLLADVQQLQMIIWWLDGNEFEIVLAMGHEQVVLRVSYDSTTAIAYPSFNLYSREKAHNARAKVLGTNGRSGENAEAQQIARRLSNTLGASIAEVNAEGSRLGAQRARNKGKLRKQARRRRATATRHALNQSLLGRGAEEYELLREPVRGSVGNAQIRSDTIEGTRRYPVARGSAHRLAFRVDGDIVELYVEGVLLGKATLSARGRKAGVRSQAYNDSKPSANAQKIENNITIAGLRAWIRIPKDTRIFWGWDHCLECATKHTGNLSNLSNETFAVQESSSSNFHRCVPQPDEDYSPESSDLRSLLLFKANDRTNDHHSESSSRACVERARLHHESNTAPVRISDRTQTVVSRRQNHSIEQINRSPHIWNRKRWIDWRDALELPLSSSPVVLPPPGAGAGVRYLAYARTRCTNEVKADLMQAAATSPAQEISKGVAPNPKSAAACAALCSSRQMGCIGYRFDERANSKVRCVLIKALRSLDPEDCDMKTISTQGDEASRTRTWLLSLREPVRPLRKPYREQSSFEPGDSFRMVGVRSQLSNVPTKIVFSQVVSKELKIATSSEKPVRKEGKEQMLQGWGIFIDWKQRRTFLASYRSGQWYKNPELQSGDSFPFTLGETFRVDVNRSADSFLVFTNGQRVATVTPSEAIMTINQVSIQGSAVERATISYARTQWRVVMGQSCVNQWKDNPVVEEKQSYGKCMEACAAAGPMCTGFSFGSPSKSSEILSGALHHLRVSHDAMGECYLQGSLKTKTISACDMKPSVNWNLQLKIARKAWARWYNLALVTPELSTGILLDALEPARTMPCVLRESSYSYCNNPLKLSKESNDQEPRIAARFLKPRLGMMESLYGGWWSATCELDASGQVHAASMTRLEVDPALTRLGLVPELSTEDLVLIRYKSDVLAFASLITIKSWEASERRATQRRLPFLFNLANPSNGTMVTCDFRFGRWEKNWMPFEFENRLLALRWFNPHSIIEVFPEQGKCSLLHTTSHPFAKGIEVHGGTPPVRFDDSHYLSLVRFRTGGWARNRETRHYANMLYLFEAKPPFSVVRVSTPFTLPSCVHQRLGMRIQVAKSFVQVGQDYLICWGELDCYSCCALLQRHHVQRMLLFQSIEQLRRSAVNTVRLSNARNSNSSNRMSSILI